MLSEEFANLYLKVLHQLQLTFNGHPDNIKSVTSDMFLMKMKAKELTSISVGEGNLTLHAGPAFEYPAC